MTGVQTCALPIYKKYKKVLYRHKVDEEIIEDDQLRERGNDNGLELETKKTEVLELGVSSTGLCMLFLVIFHVIHRWLMNIVEFSYIFAKLLQELSVSS